jgi:hypothetical protein
MSFLTELAAVMPRQARGLDVAFYPDWASFYQACPLSRAMLIKHDAQGKESLTPERSLEYFQENFFGADGVGIVLSHNGTPRSGLVFRRLAPDTVENSLRIGEPAGIIGIRPLFYQLGIRKITYCVHKQFPSTHAHMEQMAKLHNCTRTITDPDDGYVYYVDEMTEKPHGNA